MIRLTFEREKRKLSRATLARRAKMGAGDVGKIENGRMKPYRTQLVKLGRAMRMRLAEALTLTDEVDPVTGARLDVDVIDAAFDDDACTVCKHTRAMHKHVNAPYPHDAQCTVDKCDCTVFVMFDQVEAAAEASCQLERTLAEVKQAGETIDRVRAAAEANGIELAGPEAPRPRCSKCGASLPTPTVLQAAERGEPPICDACFFEQGSEAHGGAHG